MLNQNERSPLSVAAQVASIYAGTGGYLDRIKTDRVKDFLEAMLGRLRSENEDLFGRIDDGELSDEDEEALGKAIAEAIDDFGPDFDEEGNALEEGESDRIKSEEERQKEGRTAGDGDSDEGDDDSGEGDDDSDGGDASESEEEAVPA